jgi:hypothetical protein
MTVRVLVPLLLGWLLMLVVVSAVVAGFSCLGSAVVMGMTAAAPLLYPVVWLSWELVTRSC